MFRQTLMYAFSFTLLQAFLPSELWAQREFLSFPIVNFDTWKVDYQKRSGDTEIMEFVQKAETVKAWTKMVTIQKSGYALRSRTYKM